jgi:hypothetical protein
MNVMNPIAFAWTTKERAAAWSSASRGASLAGATGV